MENLTVTAGHASKPRILICDDDVEYCQELIEALRARGYAAASVLTISPGRAEILAPTVLVLDLCMPERSGLDIAKMLSLHARKDCFKIILVTGCSQFIIDSVSKQFRDRGLQMLGALQKPVEIRKLCELLSLVNDVGPACEGAVTGN